MHYMQKFKILLIFGSVVLVICEYFILKNSFKAYREGLLTRKNNLLPCSEIPNSLIGLQPINRKVLTWNQMERNQSQLMAGGHFKPTFCTARHTVAIIVPYRKRDIHLRVFINNLHPILQRQHLEYGIYIIEQTAGYLFNRGMLMNIGFVESRHLYNYTCYIFHDVDLIPENDKNMYNCVDTPRHLSVAIDVFKYQLPFTHIFGGAIAMTTQQFQEVNGFSNRYFGWGGEDDDMYNRLVQHQMSLYRYSPLISRYTMIKHIKQRENPERFEILKERKFNTDGLNSLMYAVKKLEMRKLFTLVNVALNQVNK